MNIAIVTDSYYPNMSAAASCMDKFIQKLKHKHSFTIINMLNQCEYADLDDEAIVVYPVSSLLWRWRIKCKDNIKSGKHVFINNLAINLFRISSLFMTPYAYPSPIRWSLKAFYNGLEKLHLQKQFDAVISVSDPICCSFAAKEFKKKHPEVKWIGYYTDPFTFQPSKYRQVPFKKHRWKKNFYNEKEAYDTADFNLFTEEIYKLALTEFKQPVSKTFKMKYVLSEIPYTVIRKENDRSDKIELVYAGMFLRDKRNPKHCLNILSQIHNITLDMFVNYSNCNDIVTKYLSLSIRLHPAVSRERYNEILTNEFDVLINLGNNVKLQIPSKMMELLSTGRPIINFYQLKDVHYAMIEKYPLGINIGPNDADAVERVSEFCKQMKGKRLSFEEVEALFPENTMDSQLALLEKLIEA